MIYTFIQLSELEANEILILKRLWCLPKQKACTLPIKEEKLIHV